MVGIWIKTWKRRYFENPSDQETFLSDWMKLINSHDESLSDEAWRLFEVQSKEFVLVLNYIERTWLPFEENFGSSWTEKYAHFGN